MRRRLVVVAVVGLVAASPVDWLYVALTLLCFHLHGIGHGAGSHCGVRLDTDRVDGMLR